MINITYTHSFNLIRYLEQLDQLRVNLLLYPLHPQRKLEMRWHAAIARTYALLDQSETLASKTTIDQVRKFLSNQKSQTEDTKEQKVQAFKKAFDYIRFNWLLSDHPVTFQDVVKLHSSFSKSKLRVDRSLIDQFLDYIQVKKERPIVQAAVAYEEIIRLSPFSENNTPLAYLLSYLFLYKSGLNFDDYLVIENHFKKDETNYKNRLQEAVKSGNLTGWVEYFAQSIVSQLENILKDFDAQRDIPLSKDSLFTLSPRQKEMLALFDEPNLNLTNKKVQQLYKISQITASRDLAKLASIGLIIQNGKGRSIYYTRFPRKS